ncbi:hypothetical protein F2Q68_00025125 [Brassica cretica]|uniref:Uncharacterized protein n=1 Tax=Brassica cretica TaxID=69181 RepID=A0A8S9I7M9_BRACR|nr:hypothetical protein F2Q68_00025125 [Brassica cretica]
MPLWSRIRDIILASIETHTATSIDSAQQKSTDAAGEESVDSSQREWENDYYNPTMAAHTEEYDEDYEEERAIEQRSIIDEEDREQRSIVDEEDRLFHHSSWKKKSPSIDRNCTLNFINQTAFEHRPTSLTTHRSTLTSTLPETEITQLEVGKMITITRATHHPIDIAIPPSIDTNPSTSIDINHTTSIDSRLKPKTTVSEKDKSDNQYLTPDEFGIFRDPHGYVKANDGHTLYVSREDIADILQTANGAYNLFMQQHNFSEHQQKVTKEFYDTAGGIDKSFKQRKFYWEEKDEYGIYRDDQGYARDVDGHTIRVHNKDIRRLLERASRDNPNYFCLPEHASSFTQTKLVPEIYTNDEINEMFYGVCGEQEKNKEDFQMKHDGFYYPLNDSISWLTTCMEEMRQDIARIQRATDLSRPTKIDRHRQESIDSHLHASIDNRLPASVDGNPPHSHTIKSQPDFHTSEEIDQVVEGVYIALKTT